MSFSIKAHGVVIKEVEIDYSDGMFSGATVTLQKKKLVRTQELMPLVFADLDSNNKIIAVEFLTEGCFKVTNTTVTEL
jgi:hypothetical protein